MLILLLACASSPKDPIDTATEAVDVRVSLDSLPPLEAGDLVLAGPEVVVEAGQDVMVCLFGTYTGPTVGLSNVHTYQGRGGHHFQLMGTTTPIIDQPDGAVVDCTGDGGELNMADLEPLGLPNEGTVDGTLSDLSMPLPAGMAVELEEGQRYVLQSHYLNTSADAIRIGDKVVLSTMDEAAVETWAAPVVFNRDDFSIPPGGRLTSSFACSTPADWNLLYMLGHMHEWGTAFRVDRADSPDAPFYEVATWDPVYRDAPVVLDFTDAPLAVPAGTEFTTTCSWFNDQDTPLEFPHEMCATVSFVYPQKTTVVCDGNGQ